MQSIFRRRARLRPLTAANRWILAELAAILLFSTFLAGNYLNTNVDRVPAGVEFHWVIQTHHFWTWFKECGWCALWNGSERGGFPALVDLQGAVLHPLVIFDTLNFGVVNGAKFTTLFSLFLAGLAMWWTLYELGLGRAARMWAALLAAGGAHLAGRAENGWLGIILSTATASFYFPAALRLVRLRTSREMVVLACVLALTILSGQGYIQAGLLVMLPATLILLWGEKPFPRRVLMLFAEAGGLALLLAAPLLLPLAHFGGNFSKPGDPSFNNGQTFPYYLLNLVISDPDFLHSPVLGKPPTPAHTTLFIGWTPLVLLLLNLRFARREDLRPLLWLIASALLGLLAGSGELVPLLAKIWRGAEQLRNPMLAGPIGVPPLIAAAAFGAERAGQALTGLGRRLAAQWEQAAPVRRLERIGRWLAGRLRWEWLLVIPLALNLHTVWQFSRGFFGTYTVDPIHSRVFAALRTPSLEWVGTPPGNWLYIERGIREGLKLSPGILPFDWKGRTLPEPLLQAAYQDNPPEGALLVQQIEEFGVYAFAGDRSYAAIHHDDGLMTRCAGYGVGGFLRVICDADRPGALIVKENAWEGWTAQIDGRSAELKDETSWLSVQAPPGVHVFDFRYRPWDVPLGVAIGVVGLLVSLYLLWGERKRLEKDQAGAVK